MASENLNDRRGHMLNGSTLRLQSNEIGLVNHGRKCMPGAEALPVTPHFRVIVRSAVTGGQFRPHSTQEPRTIAPPRLSPPGHRHLRLGCVPQKGSSRRLVWRDVQPRVSVHANNVRFWHRGW
jgi:hypothetical protein